MSRQPTLDPRDFYAILRRRQKEIREFAKRPLTLTEKLLYSQLRAITSKETHYGQSISRGLDFVVFYPDRIDMQDATAQMALLQLISAKVKFSFIPGAIHSDHMIVAQNGNQADVKKAKFENDEIYCFLAACGERFGLDVWTAGQ